MKDRCRIRYKIGEGRVLMAAMAAIFALCIILNANRTPQTLRAAPVSSVYMEEEDDRRLDLNLATKEDLMGLPGVGGVLAERILAYRALNGGFVHVEELNFIEGISEGTMAGIRALVTVSAEYCE